ncbi:SH3 domain-containing protein [Caballeronia sp. 15715]|uniref:SH3 domain-containing protein n=1 Tax=Caballeronia sp. 15715 TaxID=3391030 RepID=UPI0039E30D07
MRKQLLQWGCIGFAGLLAIPAVTFAQQQAYTNNAVNMRAGPAGDYPIVTQLPGGVPVTVMGCISGYTWCDVVVPNLRGWVYAGSLSYPYQGGNVPILTYGTTIGLPIVTFSIGSYWGSYYRGRPWYNQQSRWANRPPPRPGPGRPPGYGGRPPSGPPPGHGGGRPPGPPPGHGAGGRPPGPPPGQGAGGRPPGPPPGQGAGGRPPGQGGGGRPPGQPGGGRPSGPPPAHGGGGGNGGGGHGGGGGGGNGGGHGGGNNQQQHG